MLSLTLVTAINYQSSLIYLFVFVLFSIFVVSIWLCFFNLQGLRLRVDACGALEDGKTLQVKLLMLDGGKDRAGVRAILDTLESSDKRRTHKNQFVWFSNQSPNPELVLHGEYYRRGIYTMPGVKLESYFPFGLIRAWTWLWFDTPVIVYPKPVEPPSGDLLHVTADADLKKVKSTEPDDMRRFQVGDSVRRVMWRHYALRDELMVQDAEWQGSDNAQLNWATYSSFNTELALSYLCFDVLKLASGEQGFSLTMPSGEVPLGFGRQHLEQCLSLLAGFKRGDINNPQKPAGSDS